MNDLHAHPEQRDAYWQATREQLKAAQNRADLTTLLVLAAVVALIVKYYEPGQGLGRTGASAVIALALVGIGAPLWFVTRRKRRISVTRGLTCAHCGYVPHDTEITEVASSRHCQRCAQPLD